MERLSWINSIVGIRLILLDINVTAGLQTVVKRLLVGISKSDQFVYQFIDFENLKKEHFFI